MNVKFSESYYALIEVVQSGGNENEINSKFHIFVDELSNFSANEQRIFSAYRVLNWVRIDIYSKSKVINLTVFDLFERITALIDTEIKVTLLKLKNPDLIKLDVIPLPQERDTKSIYF